MSSNNGDRSLLYRGLERLSTEELKEALRADTFGAGQAMDEETFLTIADILYEREGRPAAEREAAVDAALEEFWTVYANTAPEEDLEELIGAVKTEPKTESVPKKPVKRRWKRWTIGVATIAAAFVLVIPLTKANAFNVINVVNQLFNGQFSFSSRTNDNDFEDMLFQSLLDECGAKFSFADLQIPEEYVQSELVDTEYKDFRLIRQTFENDNQQIISLDFKLYKERNFRVIYEEDYKGAEQYVSNGRTFYILKNLNNLAAVTFENNAELSVIGDLEIEDMYKILDSIY